MHWKRIKGGVILDSQVEPTSRNYYVNESREQLVASSRILYLEGEDPVKRLGKPIVSAVYAPFCLRY